MRPPEFRNRLAIVGVACHVSTAPRRVGGSGCLSGREEQSATEYGSAGCRRAAIVLCLAYAFDGTDLGAGAAVGALGRINYVLRLALADGLDGTLRLAGSA